MLFALLCYADETLLADLSRETMNALVENHVRYDYESVRTEEPGRVLAERWLKPAACGFTVRAASDDPPADVDHAGVAVVPGIDSASQALTMFYLLNCESQEEAIELAGRYPWLPYGRVEVRPIMGEWDYAPSLDCAATAAEVWRVYEDVATWPRWYPGAVAAQLDGTLAEGVRGTLTTARGDVRPILVTSVTPGTGFVTETSLGEDCMLRVEHSVVALPRGSRITHQAVIPRAALDVLGMGFSKTFNAELRNSLRALSRLAERTGP